MEQPVSPGVTSSGQPVRPPRNRALLKWSLLVTALVLGYFMWQCGAGLRAGAELSDDAVRHFHSQLDSAAYSDIVSEADEGFRVSSSRDDLIKFLTGVHSKLGLSHGFTRTGVFANASTHGTFIKVTYTTTFDQGTATEAFTWKKEGAGLKLYQYNVNSNVFVTR